MPCVIKFRDAKLQRSFRWLHVAAQSLVLNTSIEKIWSTSIRNISLHIIYLFQTSIPVNITRFIYLFETSIAVNIISLTCRINYFLYGDKYSTCWKILFISKRSFAEFEISVLCGCGYCDETSDDNKLFRSCTQITFSFTRMQPCSSSSVRVSCTSQSETK